MRHATALIKKARENGRRRAKASNRVQANTRLSSALSVCGPKDQLVFELATRNPMSGQLHYLEILHEVYGGTNRYAVYLDGAKWRNGWSRTRFARWIFNQVDSVRRDWE